MVDIKLRYRQAEQELAHTLLGAVPKDMDLAAIYGLTSMPDLPVVDMISKSEKINPALLKIRPCRKFPAWPYSQWHDAY